MACVSIEWDMEHITDPKVDLPHALAVREIKSEKRHRGEMFRAALYTYRVCYVTHLVGRRPGQLTYKDFADQLGYSKSYITKLRRLGRALVIHEVAPQSQLFSELTRFANERDVGALLDSDVPVDHRRLSDATASYVRGRSATHPPDGSEAVRSLVRVIRDALPGASLADLADFEQCVGDLFFDIRLAHRVATAEASGVQVDAAAKR